MPEAVAAWAVSTLAVTGTTAVIVSAAVYVATTVAISQVASSLLAPSSGGGGTTSPQELSTTVRQAAASRRLLYGRSKAGGVLVYPAQSDDGTFAWLDVYLGEGPIHAIDPVFWLGDERSDDPKFAGLIHMEAYTGWPGQTASAGLVAVSAGEWTSADVGTGMAHAVVRYEFDRNAFPRGLVLPAFEVWGRVVYDPRTGTTGFSSNPALCLLEYLRSEYGPDGGIADDLIDFASFAAAANICDEVVDSIDPANEVDGVAGRVRRYTLDGVFEVSAGHTAIVQTMLAAMGGAMPLVGGQYRLYAGAWRAPTGPQLTGEHLRADPTMRTHPGRTQRINTARGTYREPRQEWQTIDFHEQTLPAAVVAEAGEIVQNFSFPATTNGAIAQRLARLGMLQARSSVPLQLQCNWAAFEWQVFDVISVNLPEIGAVGTYLCVSYAYPEGGGIDLTLVPHNAGDFEWNPATMEQLVPVVVRPDFNSAPKSITGLVVLGGWPVAASEYITAYGLRATWDRVVDAQFDRYEVQYKRSDAGDWIVAQGLNFIEAVSRSSSSWEKSVSVGLYYDVRVRAVRKDGSAGPWAEQMNTLVTGDTEAPGPPTALSVTGTATHTIGWTNPTTLDVMRARVYASTTNDPATALQVAEVFGLPATAYTANHTPAIVPTYYWVAAVDRTGNASARTYAGVGN